VGVLGYLLDTRCWLWWQTDYTNIPSPVRRQIGRHGRKLHVSAASACELAMKHQQGKLRLPTTPADFVNDLVAEGAIALPITIDHAVQAALLPDHHRDPFDRFLVAQAQLEGLHLVTADPRILAYDVAAVDARR
jgi:PIN domain nuclease of toxin-antitoxin system